MSGTPYLFRHIVRHSRTGRNSSHFLSLFCCICVWEGFVWLISNCSCKRSPHEVALVRKRDALSPQLQRQQHAATFLTSSTPEQSHLLQVSRKQTHIFLTTHCFELPSEDIWESIQSHQKFYLSIQFPFPRMKSRTVINTGSPLME